MSQDKEAVARLARRRWRVALTLTAVMLVIYFGFVLLIAFDKPLLAHRLRGGFTLGICLGVFVIVAAWLLTFIYVRWANDHYDTERVKLGGSR
jgi:uncharacterized membrane protein (DUF485 family)